MKKEAHRRQAWAVLWVLGALTFASCADDFIVDNNDGERPQIDAGNWGTVFASKTDDTRTSPDYNRNHSWTFGDYVWVKDGSSFLKSDTSDIPKTGLIHDTNFYFKKQLTERSYEVRYTGNGGANGQRADSVHIAAIQVQTKLGSEHVGQFGDCGVTSADRQDDGTYTFNLKHKASFLLFTPTKSDAGKSVKLRSIKVTKLNCSEGDSALAGSYYFDADGLHVGNAMKNPSKTITLNLFTTDGNGNENYWYELPSSKKADSCLYMVLQPGSHDLSIEYELVESGNLQVVTHNKTTDRYEYSYDNTAQKWKKARRLKAGAHTFTPNGFTKVAHKIDEKFRFTIPHTYYQWGASSWVYSIENRDLEDGKENFGTGHVVGYPTNSDPSDNGHYEMIGTPLTYNTTPSYYHADEWIKFNPHPSLWLHGPINKSGFTHRIYDPNETYFHYKELPDYRDGNPRPYQCLFYINIDGGGRLETIGHYKDIMYRSIVRMPSANEMTYYLKYGDIHRDNTTLWSIDEYGGGNTICRGGIWIKKRAVIEAEGHPFSTEKSAYQINGSDLDLRNQSPGSNYMFRHYNEDAQIPATEAAAGAVADVKYGIPADPSKYFFLPLTGYIHNVANSPGSAPDFNWSQNKGQYKFVGAEGYYWTRTMWPAAYFPGEEAKKPNTDRYNLHGDREAYYLRITPYYVALCWEMRGNRMHGMVGNQRPDWYRTMPDEERIYRGWDSRILCENDTWFQ